MSEDTLRQEAAKFAREMSYQEAQDHLLRAEACLRAKDLPTARTHYLGAAIAYRHFVLSLAPDEVKARSIFGTSAAVLFYKAHELDAAEQMATYILSHDSIMPSSREELHRLLQSIRDARQTSEEEEAAEIRGQPDGSAGPPVGLLRGDTMSEDTKPTITFRPDPRHPGCLCVDGEDLRRLRESKVVGRLPQYTACYSTALLKLGRIKLRAGLAGYRVEVEK